jgi:hypothetical protein
MARVAGVEGRMPRDGRGAEGCRGALRGVTVAVSALLVGCLSHVPAAPRMTGPSRTFDAGFERVWQATVRTFAEDAIPIKTIDKESGVIVSGPITGKIGAHLDCGRVRTFLWEDVVSGSGQGTFNVLVKGDTTVSRVRVNAYWTTLYASRDLAGRAVFELPIECASFGVLETGLLGAIAQRLAR